MRRAGIAVCSAAPPVYTTTVPNIPAGALGGTLVVPMGPVPRSLVSQAVLVTARYPSGHGAPVQIGNHEALGISDLQAPDFGVVPPMGPDDVPVFWACGVTPQQVLPLLRSAYCIPTILGTCWFWTSVRRRSDRFDAAKRYAGALGVMQVLIIVLRDGDNLRQAVGNVFGNRDLSLSCVGNLPIQVTTIIANRIT